MDLNKKICLISLVLIFFCQSCGSLSSNFSKRKYLDLKGGVVEQNESALSPITNSDELSLLAPTETKEIPHDTLYLVDGTNLICHVRGPSTFGRKTKIRDIQTGDKGKVKNDQVRWIGYDNLVQIKRENYEPPKGYNEEAYHLRNRSIDRKRSIGLWTPVWGLAGAGAAGIFGLYFILQDGPDWLIWFFAIIAWIVGFGIFMVGLIGGIIQLALARKWRVKLQENCKKA